MTSFLFLWFMGWFLFSIQKLSALAHLKVISCSLYFHQHSTFIPLPWLSFLSRLWKNWKSGSMTRLMQNYAASSLFFASYKVFVWLDRYDITVQRYQLRYLHKLPHCPPLRELQARPVAQWPQLQQFWNSLYLLSLTSTAWIWHCHNDAQWCPPLLRLDAQVPTHRQSSLWRCYPSSPSLQSLSISFHGMPRVDVSKFATVLPAFASLRS